ncbi:hypothetical protein [Sporomusa aerivorans]|uniref:hypothetical protein n=1 Tax=Sporomusa aerivorans TaxID=204936 RepID=UPI00352A7F15
MSAQKLATLLMSSVVSQATQAELNKLTKLSPNQSKVAEYKETMDNPLIRPYS